MAMMCKIFEEDEVSMFTATDGYRCGIVLETSEYVSSDDDDDDEDDVDDYLQKLQRGAVRVAWHPDGLEEVLLEKNVRFRFVLV